jgi:hypothetical protein
MKKKSNLIFLFISDRQAELQLSKEQMAKRIQTDINNEYTEQIFKSIENSDQLESLSPGVGRLLVAQARAILTLNSTVEFCNEQLEIHLRNVIVSFSLIS